MQASIPRCVTDVTTSRTAWNHKQNIVKTYGWTLHQGYINIHYYKFQCLEVVAISFLYSGQQFRLHCEYTYATCLCVYMYVKNALVDLVKS